MSPAWRSFSAELDHWRAEDRRVDFWLRDDDAGAPNAALERLIALSSGAGVPLALAVIPAEARGALFEHLPATVCVLQHGVDHRNRAAPGEKKTEFPDTQPCRQTIERLGQGFEQLRAAVAPAAPTTPLKVLAPPWNRFPSDCIASLARAGYQGLSTFGARRAAQVPPGFVRVNTHVDLIDWRGSRGFVGEDIALAAATRHLAARRSGACPADEPTGWLAHHARHDASAWTFLARLFERTAQRPGLRWLSAAAIFAGPEMRA